MEVEKIANNIWKISQMKKPLTRLGLSSNVYAIKNGKGTLLIDLGNKSSSKGLISSLSGIGIKPEDVSKVIFTHFHFDHTGNPALFPNAKFYASEEEIKDLTKPFFLTFFSPALRRIKVNPLKRLEGFDVVKTPGHTSGSLCLFLRKEKILFSGDTLFRDGIAGRADLATSMPEKMEESLRKLEKIDYKVLCPGHSKNDKKRLLF